MFLVRVILFMMSRSAEDAGTPVESQKPDATKQSYRARLKAEREGLVSHADQAQNENPLTREEMTKLFGKALRVR